MWLQWWVTMEETIETTSVKNSSNRRQAPNVAVSTTASFQQHTVDEKSFTTWAFVSHFTGCHPACCIIQVPLQRETKAWPHQWHMTTASVKTYGIDSGQENQQKQRTNLKYDGKHVLFRTILWANFEIPRDFWRDLARFAWTQHQLRLEKFGFLVWYNSAIHPSTFTTSRLPQTFAPKSRSLTLRVISKSSPEVPMVLAKQGAPNIWQPNQRTPQTWPGAKIPSTRIRMFVSFGGLLLSLVYAWIGKIQTWVMLRVALRFFGVLRSSDWNEWQHQWWKRLEISVEGLSDKCEQTTWWTCQRAPSGNLSLEMTFASL